MALLRIKNWEPHHEAIVLAFLGGASLSEIAEKSGYSYSWVSSLLKTPEALERISKVRANSKVAQEGTIHQRLAALQSKALERVENFINNDTNEKLSPFQFFDRALKVAQGTGAIASGTPTPNINIVNNTQNNIQNNAVLSNDMAAQLLDAFKGADEVKRLHAGVIPENVE